MSAALLNNVERMRAFITQVQEQGRIDLFDKFIHPAFQDHLIRIGQSNDRNALREVLQELHAAFSNIKIEVVLLH